ncbi:hydroxymethylglutaryl-CoA lyase [Halalkalibacter nanhaiisediminis]|uniref:Hydroxymethylglutaryl-CoA lyase n=1 Tax=Halalkalibacter nanhaiisediminis TaxID=688079 RepID=A0A562QMZ8_9BACI|nr:hydroxymethylglutaryl-CoA lyase [Halalkalibacter nanhaiisediminis]TWI58107.1 hydroxymethylglutaryl-CoA lyase [Halalkalibacter nanhaiisediminis]
MNLSKSVTINEVALRDGLQLEEKILTVAEKKLLFEKLENASILNVEFGSFVHPKAVPQMANSKELFMDIGQKEHVTLISLIPNLKGAQIAAELGVKEVNYVFSISNTHNEQNVRKSTERSLEGFKDIKLYCDLHNIVVDVTLATSFGCPFEGKISEEKVLALTDQLIENEAHIVTFADTTGMANPEQIYRLMSKVKQKYPQQLFGLHLHNTRGMGLANIIAGMQAGINRFDTALGGIGGCPFAPGATGNVCTEDVVHMLEEMGIQTNIQIDPLLEASHLLKQLLGQQLPSYVAKAGKSTRKYPVPNQA